MLIAPQRRRTRGSPTATTVADPPPLRWLRSTPIPFRGLGQCQAYTCGFLFTALADVSVQALGQWDENLDGLSIGTPVGLWSSDGTLLASVVVPSGTAAPLTGAYPLRPDLARPADRGAGEYVIASAQASGGAPVFGPAGALAVLMPVEGRVVFAGAAVLAFPSSSRTTLFGGGNFLFVPPAQ